MAFRVEAAIAFGLMAWVLQGAQTRVAARHDHWRKQCQGPLTISEGGIRFEGSRHREEWKWVDIQEVLLSAQELKIVTYRDVKWKLGADRQFLVELPKDASLAEMEQVLRAHLRQKYVAAWSAPSEKPEWTLPAKHLERFSGTLGTIEGTPSGLAFRADKQNASRTWTWVDIEAISSANPYELTLTTFERSRTSYGGRRDFTFQLREPLDEPLYRQLWRRVERAQRKSALNILDEFTK